MKIVINSRFLTQQLTGVQRFALEISRQLKKSGRDMKFIAPPKIFHKSGAEELDAVSYGKFTGHFWEQLDLPRYLRKARHPLLVNLANTAPLFYKNQIITIHDLAFLRNPSWFSKTFYCFYRFLLPAIAENSLKIITVSEFSKKEIMRLLNIPGEKIKVVRNAVSESFPDSAEHASRYCDEEYLLAVSSMDPRKNIKNLLASFNRLNLKDMKLIVAGPENKIFASGKSGKPTTAEHNVAFTGYTSDKELAVLYRNAKMFVYPSLYEGFGLPPLEAMACGCPVVVSNVASLPEVCGDAAYYVDPYDVESIADGMYRVLTDDDLRQNLIKKGFERVKLFSWEKSAKEHIRVFDEVLNK